MVLGIGRIDGDEWHVPPVFALRHRGRLGFFRLIHHLLREDVRDAMRIDGDHRDRLFRRNGSDDREHTGARQAETTGTYGFALDQIAMLGIAQTIGLYHHFLAAPVCRQEADLAIGKFVHDAERGSATFVDHLDDACRIGGTGAILVREDLCENSVVEAGGRGLTLAAVFRRLTDQHGRCRTLVFRPFRRTADQLSILVAGGDVENRDGGQGAGTRQGFAALVDQTLVFQLAKQVLQLDARFSLQPESLGNLALGGLVRIVGDEFKQDFARRDGALDDRRFSLGAGRPRTRGHAAFGSLRPLPLPVRSDVVVLLFAHVSVFFVFAAVFFAGAFLAAAFFGAAFLVSPSALAAAFFGFALAFPEEALPPFSMISAMACSIVTDCGSMPLGSVALTLPQLT
ncbi:hypothetical protein D3C73_808690 [compost metagenome]